MDNLHNSSFGFQSSPWTKYNLEDQLLRHQDGHVFNLSEIDWSSVNVYEYDETGNSSHSEYEVVSTGRTVALFVFTLIFFVGLVGNSLVVYTVGRYEAMRRGTYLYLLNLAVTDMLYLLVCLPTLSASYALVDWRFGKVFCKLENYVMSVTMSVSVLTIMATGLDRYVAVIYPLRSRNLRTTKKTVAAIVLTWVVSLVAMAPRIAIFDEVSIWHVVGLTTLCTRVQTDHILQLDTTLNFVFMYLLPLLGLTACHFRIGQRLWSSRRPGTLAAQKRPTGTLLVRDRRRIAMMVFAITVVFAVGWLPIHVYHLVEDFNCGNLLFGQYIDRGTIALFFSFGANSLNPIFYCLFSSSFRKHFRKTFFFWNKRRRAAGVSPGDVRMVKAPIGQSDWQEYRRPPPVLLPRPASILSSPAKQIDNISFSFNNTTCPTFTSLKVILPAEFDHHGNHSDTQTIYLSHFAKNTYPVYANNTNDASRSNNLKYSAPLSPLSSSSDKAGFNILKNAGFQRDRSSSLPDTIPSCNSSSVHIYQLTATSTWSERISLTSSTRRKSTGDIRSCCKSDRPVKDENTPNRNYIDDKALNITEDSETCHQHDGFRLGTHLIYNNYVSLPSRQQTNETRCKTSFSNRHSKSRRKNNASFVQESSRSLENNEPCENETSLSVSATKLPKCNLNSGAEVQAPSSGNDRTKTAELEPATSSLFDASYNHNLNKPECNTMNGSYVDSVSIATASRNTTNRGDNIPPVE